MGVRKSSFSVCGLGFFVLSAGAANFATGAEYLVKWKHSERRHYLAARGVRVLGFLERAGISHIAVADRREVELIARGADVDYIVENKPVHAFTSNGNTTAPLLRQWALEKISASAAWALVAGAENDRKIIVAILDTGVDYTHASLRPNLLPGYDFVANDSDATDEIGIANPGHGTHCAGIIAATGKVGGGVIGISSTANILPLRILDKNAHGTLAAAVAAIDYAIEQKVDIISASWGGEMTPAEARPLSEAVQRASDAGILFVTAAGNGDQTGQGYSNDEHDIYPANANFGNTVTVAASDEQDRAPRFSNFGHRRVAIAAPGTDIMSTVPINRYDDLSGTSMSSPFVAGLAALIKAFRPALDATAIKALLLASGDKVDIDTACQCRINAGNAMAMLVRETPFLAPYVFELQVAETSQVSVRNSAESLMLESADEGVVHVAVDGRVIGVGAGSTRIIARNQAGAEVATSLVNVSAH